VDETGSRSVNGKEAPAVRIFLRPLGSPLTIGMSGLSIATLVDSGLDLRWVSLNQTHDVGLILLSVPFALQMIACIFAYLSRDGAAGAALGVLSLTWFSMGLIEATSTPGSRSGALGLMLLVAGGVLFLSAMAVMVPKPLPGSVFALAAARFILTGIYLLGASGGWRHAAGILGLVVLGGAAYSVLAFELEGEQHRPVLPTFRRRRAHTAVHGDPWSQVDGVTSEAGVRQTT
jgi:succinate-acetate transporter protein